MVAAGTVRRPAWVAYKTIFPTLEHFDSASDHPIAWVTDCTLRVLDIQ